MWSKRAATINIRQFGCVILLSYTLLSSTLIFSVFHECFSFHLNAFKTILVTWLTSLRLTYEKNGDLQTTSYNTGWKAKL